MRSLILNVALIVVFTASFIFLSSRTVQRDSNSPVAVAIMAAVAVGLVVAGRRGWL